MTLTEGDRTPPRPALAGSRVRELAGSRLAAPATALLLVAASTAMVAAGHAHGALRRRRRHLPGGRARRVVDLRPLVGARHQPRPRRSPSTSSSCRPQHTLVINSSSDWAALAAFALTALVTIEPGLARAPRARRGRAPGGRGPSQRVVRDADRRRRPTWPACCRRWPARRLAGAGRQPTASSIAASPVAAGAAPLGADARLQRPLDGRAAPDRVPPGALERPAAARIARSLAGLIALGEERERRLQQQVQAEALARSNELKTALLRAVSHDMRSPLMAITTAAGGLRYAGLDEDDRELLETITDQSARMNRMIENLLDLSKLQAGAVAPHADWLDPRELVEASVDELQREPARTRERSSSGSRHDLPLVRGDASQLQRVVVNLLENALKFSPPDAPVQVDGVGDAGGSSRSRCSRQRAGRRRRRTAERIFEPFYRSPQPARGAGVGAGAGHRARAGRGQRLPAGASARTAGRRQPLHARAAGAGAGKRRVTAGATRILVVDDERPIRRALEVTLAKAGYAVATAIDAAETLTAGGAQPARPGDPRPDAARRRRRRRLPAAARLDAGADPADLGRRRGAGQDPGARRRRRRLPDQAVRHRRAAGTRARAAAPLRGRRLGRAGDRGGRAHDRPAPPDRDGGRQRGAPDPDRVRPAEGAGAGRRPAAHPPDAAAQGVGARLRAGDAAAAHPHGPAPRQAGGATACRARRSRR